MPLKSRHRLRPYVQLAVPFNLPSCRILHNTAHADADETDRGPSNAQQRIETMPTAPVRKFLQGRAQRLPVRAATAVASADSGTRAGVEGVAEPGAVNSALHRALRETLGPVPFAVKGLIS